MSPHWHLRINGVLYKRSAVFEHPAHAQEMAGWWPKGQARVERCTSACQELQHPCDVKEKNRQHGRNA